jgi:hypothetical protein
MVSSVFAEDETAAETAIYQRETMTDAVASIKRSASEEA